MSMQRVPLSVHQLGLLRHLDEKVQGARQAHAIAVSAMVAAVCDPATVQGAKVQVDGDALVITWPEPSDGHSDP